MSVMTSFKRKRIERWCEDVGQYLKNGTICKTVIGNVAEDAIRGVAIVAKETINEADNNNFTTNSINGTSGNTNLNAKVDLAKKKAAQALTANDVFINNNNNNNINRDNLDNGNPLDATSAVPGNSLPIVKFAYSHYHEQRRKIDRLVQGLPVLTANGLSTLDRPSSKTSTEDHVPIIIVNGEEPVRSSHTRSRSSSQPRRELPTQHSGTRNGSNNVIASSHINNMQQSLSNHRGPLEASSSNFHIHQNQSTSSPHMRRHDTGNGAGRRLYEYNRTIGNGHIGVTVDPGLALTTNDRIARIKTAPVPNRNLHRARQRILTRRGNRILEPSTQIPLQNCWAMAELTW